MERGGLIATIKIQEKIGSFLQLQKQNGQYLFILYVGEDIFSDNYPMDGPNYLIDRPKVEQSPWVRTCGPTNRRKERKMEADKFQISNNFHLDFWLLLFHLHRSFPPPSLPQKRRWWLAASRFTTRTPLSPLTTTPTTALKYLHLSLSL